MLPIRRLPSALLASTLALLAFAGCTDDDDGAPADHVYAQTTSLTQYGSCSQLETDLEDMLIREVWANIDRWNMNRGWGGIDGAEGDSGTGGSPTSGDGRQEGVDYSGTNNQEAGVDEADLVKTDGYHVYTLNGNRLHIFGVPQFGQLTPESVTKIEGHPREMLLDKDGGRAVVFSMINVGQLPVGHPLRALTGFQESDASRWYWRSSALSKMTVLDISDRTAPRLIREVYYEGQYQTARKIDTSVRVSTYSLIDRHELNGWWDLLEASGNNKTYTKNEMKRRIRNLKLRDLIPQMFVRNPSGVFTTHGLDQASCQSFYRPTDSHARGIASIISFDLLGDNLKFDADHVVSNWATFYSSQDKIVLAEPSHDWWWYWWFNDDQDQLNVHVFDISQPGKSRYTGSGRVLGQLSDQFAIDEDNGEIRLATTTNINRWWWNWGEDDAQEPPPMESHVFVLQPSGEGYVPVGHLGGLAHERPALGRGALGPVAGRGVDLRRPARCRRPDLELPRGDAGGRVDDDPDAVLEQVVVAVGLGRPGRLLVAVQREAGLLRVLAVVAERVEVRRLALREPDLLQARRRGRRRALAAAALGPVGREHGDADRHG
ncbi:MAG: beta-propeller domain-containing protein, partial [Deltaproteobacteria bacterium]|nr:beta-propeller domain-containing protein [Deltaproteobacteria bacterium]